ncbi:MAG: bifunctional diguanylate cyclase/phosphodiesterase [Lachnospiraceae bacterium]|nr:bifunctional diguanylate cyclase/phosphodiesterase [Lachnospiraceae bacterium]
MDKKREEIYYRLLEKMTDSMTDPENFAHDQYIGVLSEIADLFRISKIVTEFYKTVSQEKIGDGEIVVDLDKEKDSKVILRKRFVTKTMAVVKATLYAAKDEAPLPEDELASLDILTRAMLSFVSRNRLQNAVEQLGFYDESGYPNLRSFKRFLEKANENGGLYGYTAGCFNLKNFTLINQEIGREKADVAMKNYISLISSLAGNDSVVCRMSSDNFVLVFRNERTKKIIDALSGMPVSYDKKKDKRVLLSANAGFFRIPEGYIYKNHNVIMEKIVSTAMMARQNEKTLTLFYEEDFSDITARNVQFLDKMSNAIDKGEFRVFYQPKIDIRTGNIIGAEALCRWFCDGKVIMPEEFIPQLEQSLEICRLDYYMLDMVCRDIRRWLVEGRKAIKISVNLSRKHLVDADLIDHIMEIIDKHEVPHRYIEIEMMEPSTDFGFNNLKKLVASLQEEGVYTAVDDFGKGYSSLNLIREIPWNVLKIDRSFLPLDTDKKNSTRSLIYSNVVAMARDLGIECITVGVETTKQIETLRNCRCYFAQGFVFDEPLPVSKFEKKLENPHYKIP